MRVFVTGGSGLVGRHVIAALRARGDEVSALARSDSAASALSGAGARPVKGSLADMDAIGAAMKEADAVVHAAAAILDHGPWSNYQSTNVAPTEAIARLAAAGGKRLVHLSSVAVYGRRTVYDNGGRSVNEDFGMDRALFPGDHYARSKRAAEQALWRVAAEGRLSAVALRPCVIYGEGDRTFSNRVARVLARGWAPLLGSGNNTLGVVYAGSVASAVLAALDRPHVSGAFNVANDGPITQLGFLESFARGLGVRLSILRVPRSAAWQGARLLDAALRVVRPRGPMTKLKAAVQFLGSPNPFDSSRAGRDLEWAPHTPPLEAVERTARWFRDAKSV